MADQKISQLTAGTPALDGDEIAIARAGANRRLTLLQALGLRRGRKNYIRNGDFQIAQRGASIAGITTSQYTLDNMIAGGNGTTTVSQQLFTVGQTDVPGNPKFYGQIDRTVAAGGANSVADWIIEFPDRLSGKQVTFSFWAAIGTGTKEFHLDFLSLGVTPVIQTSAQPITLTTAWQKFSYTTTIPAMTAVTGAARLAARITELFVFTTFTLRMSSIQVELGASATDFEALDFEEQLAWSQRFLQKSFRPTTAPAQNAGVAGSHRFVQVVGAAASQIWGWVPFRVQMRATPTVTLYNPSAANAQIRNENAGADGSATSASNATEDGFLITGTTAAGSVAGQQNAIHWLASAEL